MSTLIFEDTHLSIFHYEDKNYLYLRWNGLIESERFRALADEIIKAVEKTKTDRLLSDNTNWKNISPNDQGWAANQWFPRAEEKGIKLLATVLSTDYFNRLAERSIEDMAVLDCMQIKNFNSVGQALEWLTKPLTKVHC